MYFHHLLIFGFLHGFPLAEHLWSQRTVFAVFHQKGREVKPLRGHLGSSQTMAAHTQPIPLRNTLSNHVLELFLGQQSRGGTPPEPLFELGSGAQVTIQIHRENIMFVCAPKVDSEPSSLLPEGKSVPTMMGQACPRLLNRCPRTMRTTSLPLRFLLSTHVLH